MNKSLQNPLIVIKNTTLPCILRVYEPKKEENSHEAKVEVYWTSICFQENHKHILYFELVMIAFSLREIPSVYK